MIPAKSTGELAGEFLAFVVVILVSYLLTVWLVTLCVGAAHGYDHRIPALGARAVSWLIAAAYITAGAWRVGSNRNN